MSEELDPNVCVDCGELIACADGDEPTDPPLCHDCEKSRLRKQAETMRCLLSEVLTGADVLTDRSWMRRARMAVK